MTFLFKVSTWLWFLLHCCTGIHMQEYFHFCFAVKCTFLLLQICFIHLYVYLFSSLCFRPRPKKKVKGNNGELLIYR